MGGWTGRGKDGITWNGDLQATSFKGDGSGLFNVGVNNLDGGDSISIYTNSSIDDGGN